MRRPGPRVGQFSYKSANADQRGHLTWIGIVARPRSKAVRIANSHLITSCATIAALFLFVGLGSQVLPNAFGPGQLPDSASSLSVAFVLNIAIILFGWRRSKDLREALDAACCARIGGDEFALLLEGATAAAAEQVARAILERLDRPVLVHGAQAQVSASIGLALLDKTPNQEDVLRRSDVALYAAKRAGRAGFAWFDEELERELTERLKLEEEIRDGIRKGEFIPFFQPLIDLETREMVGFEALARWRSPTRGFLEAETFIEMAESSGLIGPLTFAVMQQALTEARDWPQHFKIAVNISPVQFRDATLAEQIIKVLAATGFPAHRLEIEITEGSLLEDREQFSTIIHSLKNVGISISLDDFGTGYASLAQVNRLP